MAAVIGAGALAAGGAAALAQRLLEETDAPVGQVASRSGFPPVAAMRATFAERLTVSPLQYRRTFRSYVDDKSR